MKIKFSSLFLDLLPFVIVGSIAMGGWTGYISHCQHMSLVRSLNSSK